MGILFIGYQNSNLYTQQQKTGCVFRFFSKTSSGYLAPPKTPHHLGRRRQASALRHVWPRSSCFAARLAAWLGGDGDGGERAAGKAQCGVDGEGAILFGVGVEVVEVIEHGVGMVWLGGWLVGWGGLRFVCDFCLFWKGAGVGWRIGIVDVSFFFEEREAPNNFDNPECEGIRFYSPIFLFLGRGHLHPKAEEVELHRIPFPQNDPRRQYEAACWVRKVDISTTS